MDLEAASNIFLDTYKDSSESPNNPICLVCGNTGKIELPTRKTTEGKTLSPAKLDCFCPKGQENRTPSPKKHVSETSPFLRSMGIPPGFTALLWSEAKIGEEVYLLGSQRNSITEAYEVKTYGPHTVLSIDRQELKNSKGETIPIKLEGLLKKTA